MENNLWYKNAIFYEVYIRAFRDSNGNGHGDLRGLLEKLDYIKDLGVDCIWLLPFYPSPLLDDGYDIADYYGIHPDYGTLEDFQEVLREAHARGLKVITDLVLNHTSDQHPWFKEARANPDSSYRNYYVWSDTNDKYVGARIIFLDTEVSNWTYDEVAEHFFWHRFYSSQPDLNYDNFDVQLEMMKVVSYWMDMGIDGFRADAVPYLFERPGTNCENLPETHEYLKRLRHFVEEHYPGRVLLCEANQWPEDVREYFGDGDEFHMAFHFPVMPRIYMALAQADRTPIVNILNATPPIPEDCQWCTFLRNHDELTLEMVTPDERHFMWETYAPDPRMRLNLGIRRRLAPLLDGDRRKIELVNSILFSLPGSPIIYYGDEIGMGDNIWLYDRDGVRTPMQWDDSLNAGFSDTPTEKLFAPVIEDEVYGYQKVNAASQEADPGSILNTMRRMIKTRKAYPVFSSGDNKILEIESPSVLVFLRTYQGKSIYAVHNLSDQTQVVNIDLRQWKGDLIRDILSGQSVCEIGDEIISLDLIPYQYMWLMPEKHSRQE
jgi:maltose alpha-D-glucosyltransferase / alpha-amylase